MKESLTSAQFHLSLPGPNPTSELLLGRIWGTFPFGGCGVFMVGLTLCMWALCSKLSGLGAVGWVSPPLAVLLALSARLGNGLWGEPG